MADSILVSREGRVAQITFNRPDFFNAFNSEMIESLANHLTSLAVDQEVAGVIITGAGKAFCAGGDLRWALGWPAGAPAAFYELAARFHQAIREIRRMAKPVIAAINGVAAGGGFTLSLSCDFRVMDRTAKMRQAFTANGLSIDGGGTFNLPRLVGLARALEIAALDPPIEADQALEWGLVTRLAEPGQALAQAHALFDELSQRSLHSFSFSKLLMTDSFDTSFETQIERERKALFRAASHPHGMEGLQAFVEKRKPNYS